MCVLQHYVQNYIDLLVVIDFELLVDYSIEAITVCILILSFWLHQLRHDNCIHNLYCNIIYIIISVHYS